MKKQTVIAALLAAGLSLTSCGSKQNDIIQSTNMTNNIQPQKVSAAEADEPFCAGQTAFALALLQQSVSADPESNLLVSPYSVMQALAMTANGADGETRTQMEDVLGGMPMDALNPYLYSMRMHQPNEEHCRLITANSIWMRDDAERIQVKPDFLQTNADYFDADAYKAPFDDSTCKEINQWCSDHTDSMIPELLKEINADSVMYLINAVLFDAKWASPYKDEPLNRNFTALNGTLQTAPLMYSDEHRYLEDDHAIGFMKYYEGGQYAFAALLPEEGLSPADYLAGLTADSLRETLTNPEKCDVRAGLPVFSYDYDTELSDVLQTMGMPLAFSGSADFSRMAETGTGELFISRVLHKTHIDVNTEGTRAAAVTAIEMTEGAALVEEEPKHVILDRPFVYMILDTETSLPVFAGVLNEISS